MLHAVFMCLMFKLPTCGIAPTRPTHPACHSVTRLDAGVTRCVSCLGARHTRDPGSVCIAD